MVKMTEDWQTYWKQAADGFDKIPHVPSLLKTYQSAALFAHGDFDGTVGCIMAHSIFPNVKKWEVIFTFPHLINTHQKTKPYKLVVCVDLAINNRDPRKALAFINRNKNKLVWFDHHHAQKFNMPNVIIRKRDSIGELLQELFPAIRYTRKVQQLIKYAHQTDMGNGENIFNHALKVRMKPNETRFEILAYGTGVVGGEGEQVALDNIEYKASKYPYVRKNTQYAFDNFRTVIGDVSILDLRKYRRHTIDWTLLSFLCYKETPFCVIKFMSHDRRKKDDKRQTAPKPYLKISRTPRTEVNLLKVFNLYSGADFKITIRNWYRKYNRIYKDSEIAEILMNANK